MSFSAAGQTCKEQVVFTPRVPGPRAGAVELLDFAGRVLGAAKLSGSGFGGLGILSPGNGITVAGGGASPNSIGDGGAATNAVLSLPTGVAMDGAGNIYIADSAQNWIRMVCASRTSAIIRGTTCAGAGIISTIAGNGMARAGGDEAPASAAGLNDPTGVAVDGVGNLYIADTGNNAIRVIAASTGNIATVAGGGSGGFSGDEGPARAARLNRPRGVTLDANGNLYIADTGNHRIRRINAADETTSTVAGNGSSRLNGEGRFSGDGGPAAKAELNSPGPVAFDAAGNMYIPDTANNRVRMVHAVDGAITEASEITTFAGNGTAAYSGDGGAAIEAGLRGPSSVAVDAAGNVWIADTGNNAIRKVNAATLHMTTVAGAGVGRSTLDGEGNPTLNAPTGIFLDGEGDLFVADAQNRVVRVIDGKVETLAVPQPVRQLEKSKPMSVTIENAGNAPLEFSSIVPGQHAGVNDAVTTCGPGNAPLEVAGDCAIGAVFAPTGTGRLAGNISIRTARDTSLFLQLVGQATAANATTTSVASTLNPAGFGQTVNFTAVVQTGTGTGNLSGTVTFFDGAAALASGVLPDGQATTVTAMYSTASLAVGRHAISATYSGDAGHSGSSSTENYFGQPQPPLMEDVLEGTSTKVASSANPSAPGESVTFTATAAALPIGGLMPDGSITFMDGTTILANVALDGTATATYTTARLAAGAHPITSTYGGDAAKDILGSTSQTLNQQVLTVTAPGFTVSLNPSLTLKTKESATLTVTLASNAGFADTIALGCASLPIGVSCHFSPVSVALAGNGAATDQLTIDMNNLPPGGAPAKDANGEDRTSLLAGAVATFSLMFGAILWHFRKRHKGVWNVLLALLLSAATLLMAGCSGTIVVGTAPGVYVIQVTGTGMSTKMIRSQNVTLTVAK